MSTYETYYPNVGKERESRTIRTKIKPIRIRKKDKITIGTENDDHTDDRSSKSDEWGTTMLDRMMMIEMTGYGGIDERC